MTPRNNLGCVPEFLSTANTPKITMPIFIGSATPSIAVSSSYRYSEMLKNFRMIMFRRSKLIKTIWFHNLTVQITSLTNNKSNK